MSSDGWEELRLGDVLPLRYGKGLRASERVRSGSVPVYGSNGPFDFHDKTLTNGPVVVVGRKGSIGQVHFVGEPCWVGDTAFYVDKTDSVDIYFAYCLLSTLRLSEMNTDSAVPGLNRENAHRLLVRLPPLDEQRAIAAVLGAFDDYIESLFAKAMLYDGMMQAVYQQLANERVERVRLGDVVEINPKTPLGRGAEVPYFDMNSLPERGFLPASPARRPYGSGTRFVPGDVLLARITPCLENGKTGIVPPVEGGIAWGSTEFIVMRASREIRGLVYGLSRSPEFRAYAIQHMIGSSGRQRVKAEDIARYRVPDLTSSVATRLGAFAADWIDAGMAIRDKIETLANLRDALLPKLVSGEIQIEAPERFLDRAA